MRKFVNRMSGNAGHIMIMLVVGFIRGQASIRLMIGLAVWQSGTMSLFVRDNMAVGAAGITAKAWGSECRDWLPLIAAHRLTFCRF